MPKLVPLVLLDHLTPEVEPIQQYVYQVPVDIDLSRPPARNDNEYDIDWVGAVGSQRRRGGKRLVYLVKWTGYPYDEMSWEPEQNISEGELNRAWNAYGRIREDTLGSRTQIIINVEPTEVDQSQGERGNSSRGVDTAAASICSRRPTPQPQNVSRPSDGLRSAKKLWPQSKSRLSCNRASNVWDLHDSSNGDLY